MHADTKTALLAAIRAEVQADPSELGYAGKSAGEVAALMDAPVTMIAPTAHRDVSISDVEGYLRARLILAQLRPWAEAAPAGAAKLAALELLDIIASPRLSRFTTSTESGRANLLGLFATLVAATGGIVTQQHIDDLTAMTVEQGAATTGPPRWLAVIDGISGVANDPGPPNAADEALIQEALDG